jgi:hypothetical protein
VNQRLSANAIAEHIRSIYADEPFKGKGVGRVLADNVFAVTIRFGSADLQGSHQDPSTHLCAYDRWFRNLMFQSFGNHLGRKRHMQPLSYAFLDYPNSRGQQTQQVSEFFLSGLLHIHAVIALRLGHGQACRLCLNASATANQDERFSHVHIETFDPSRGSLEHMIDYFKKGSDAIGPYHRADCYDVFPR